MTQMSSTIDAKIGIGKNKFRGRPSTKKFTRLVARRGIRGEVNLPPGVGRFGRKEDKKRESKRERKNGRFEDLEKGLHALTRRVGGFLKSM